MKQRTWALFGMAIALASCNEERAGVGGVGSADAYGTGASEGRDTEGSGTATSAGPAPSTGDGETNTPGEPEPTTSATAGASNGADASDGASDSDGATSPTDLPYTQSFAGPDGAPWNSPWEAGGSHVISSELLGGRGRFNGDTASVARMVLPGFSETDVDVTITVEFDDWTRQGFGFYVRQNGGVLQQTNPPGQGYAAYVEGGFMGFMGLWRETNGVEEPLANASVAGGYVESGQPYRLRFQCATEAGSTRLRTRLWPADEPEPDDWLLDILDDTPVLQGRAGSFAVDVYNYVGTDSVRVDDLRIDPL